MAFSSGAFAGRGLPLQWRGGGGGGGGGGGSSPPPLQDAPSPQQPLIIKLSCGVFLVSLHFRRSVHLVRHVKVSVIFLLSLWPDLLRNTSIYNCILKTALTIAPFTRGFQLASGCILFNPDSNPCTSRGGLNLDSFKSYATRSELKSSCERSF